MEYAPASGNRQRELATSHFYRRTVSKVLLVERDCAAQGALHVVRVVSMRRKVQVLMHELEPCNLVAWRSKEALDLPYSMPKGTGKIRRACFATRLGVGVCWRLEFALREVRGPHRCCEGFG